jgi:hypothetical protein
MRAEALAHRWWAALLLGAVLLSTGCVTLAPRHGANSSERPRPLSTLRETVASTPPLEVPSALASTDPGEEAFSSGAGPQERLHRRRSARGLGPDAALASAGEATRYEVLSVGPATEGPPSCGGQSVPAGWPDFSSGDSEALLAPFLTCSSPAEYVALQERVDMPRLLEALDDWSAVRLGALGPVREDAAHLLQRKRTGFLLSATGRYGHVHAEVFALYLLHSAYDDEVNEVLGLLAEDKQLSQTLGLMPAVQGELERRGRPLSRYTDRGEQAGDVLRGLGRAAKDVLATSPLSDGTRYTELSARRAQLPPPYLQAAQEVERALALRHFSEDSVALGSFDHLTFGAPLGAYYLLAGLGHGGTLAVQGEYEQATREMAPGVLLVTVFVGGKGLGSLSKGKGTAGVRLRLLNGLEAMEARLGALQETARQLQGLMGREGLRELARYIQASREAGRFVAVGGADAALALYEAQGNVGKARPLLSKAKPGATGAPPGKSGAGAGAGEAALAEEGAHPSPKKAGVAEGQGTLASLVDEGASHTLEVVEAKLAAVELEATGPRLPRDVGTLKQYRPSLDAPPPEARGNPRWREYVDYYEKRLGEVEKGTAAEGPLQWSGYERMRGWFARGLAFERDMVRLLKEDAQKPRAQRSFLRDFDTPRIEANVGVRKPSAGLRYADVLVIEEGKLGGGPPRVETFSFKSRDFSGLDREALTAQMKADAREALQKYGERLDIRRGSLQRLFGEAREVRVSRVRLIYEGAELMPKKVDALERAVSETQEVVPEVEVVFQ